MPIGSSENHIIRNEAIIAQNNVFGLGQDKVCPAVEEIVLSDKADAIFVKSNIDRIVMNIA